MAGGARGWLRVGQAFGVLLLPGLGSAAPATSMCDGGVKYFYVKGHFMTYMLFAGWEVRRVKNCDRSLENAAFSSPRSQFFTIRTDPKPVNNFFFFLSPKRREKTHASVTVTVVRDRKIRTALRTYQIAEFVTVTA